ncbi:MAG TPA: bifunctional demethylmenaquinone methyltransferase/2-methoxy-6-polyprenyl-1,4-benzoquinol methylase UbiE [Puia sp.]|nr:bifunctional demethylmenaquinone methyltransferase/2-methoxy-6-polyprenyl-1,4-benzoquinol methylase UbiE [Puia sp.]
MSPYEHDTIVPFQDSGLSKKEQVAAMFNHICRRYDFLNRFLSGGADLFWRKMAIRELETAHPKKILDVATGTGDLAIMMAQKLAPEKIIGIDIARGMLDLGREKIAKLRLNPVIELQEGDSEAINFPDGSFDAVTVAFGVRNFQDLEGGLSEMQRVIKPGGKLMVLEFSKPRKGFFLPLYKVYLRYIAPRIGKIVSGSPDAYQYLNDSVNAFPEGDAFTAILKKCGFINTYSKKLSLGICTIYCGTKKDSAGPSS